MVYQSPAPTYFDQKDTVRKDWKFEAAQLFWSQASTLTPLAGSAECIFKGIIKVDAEAMVEGKDSQLGPGSNTRLRIAAGFIKHGWKIHH